MIAAMASVVCLSGSHEQEEGCYDISIAKNMLRFVPTFSVMTMMFATWKVLSRVSCIRAKTERRSGGHSW
jgi:hypothetical protein